MPPCAPPSPPLPSRERCGAHPESLQGGLKTSCIPGWAKERAVQSRQTLAGRWQGRDRRGGGGLQKRKGSYPMKKGEGRREGSWQGWGAGQVLRRQGGLC